MLPLTLLVCSMSAAYAEQTQQESTATVTAAGKKTIFAVNNQEDSEAKQRLKEKLGLVEGFSAQFKQDVIDTDGNVLQSSTGTLAVKRPNLIHWETQAPDETLVISDGETLWFYNPFVEQVSAYTITNAVSNTPILLLSGLDESAWQEYRVEQQDSDHFSILSLNEDAQVKKLDLIFAQKDLKKFTVTDATGQLSHFNLTNIVSAPSPLDSLFTFTLPADVDFDDQR